LDRNAPPSDRMPPDLLYQRIHGAIAKLAEEFTGVFSPETVSRCAYEAFDSLRDAAVIDFVPSFTYRFARGRLRAQAQMEGMMSKERPEVLFVCVHNAGRSQMAAVLTSALSGGKVHVRSAGSAPANEVNPRVVEAMAELGMDMSHEFPKPLTDDVVLAADVVITMGCGDACPVFPGRRYLDWQVPDPAGQDLDAVRAIRDQVRERVEILLKELGVSP